jgi:hypothetical protein
LFICWIFSLPFNHSKHSVAHLSQVVTQAALYGLLYKHSLDYHINCFMNRFYVVLLAITVSSASYAQTVLVSPTGDGGFETGGTLAANNWTAVNHTTNTWQVGTAATAFAGTNSAYLSNDGGTTWAYTVVGARTSHFYRDVTVPPGETKITLSFQWKGNGDANDRLLIYTAPISVTPVAGTPVAPSTLLTGASLVFTQPSAALAPYASATITLPAAFAGTTFRLIFTWQNNGSGGTSPGASVDDISVTSAVPSTITSNAVSGLWSAPGTWAGGAVPIAGDNVIIADGATVTIDGNYSVSNLTVGQGVSGILQYDGTARTFTTYGDITIAAGGTFKSAASGSTSTVTTHALSANGSLTNNGTLNFSATAGAGGTTINASGALLTFAGGSDATFDCSSSSAITNLRSTSGLIVNKGSSNSTILDFTPPISYQSAAGATSVSTTITVASTTNLSVGMYVTVLSGTGSFAAGTTVSGITDATTFVVSSSPSVALSGGSTIIVASKFAVTSSAGLSTGFLSITAGSFKIGGSNSFQHAFFTTASYSIPAAGGIWLNNFNATIIAHFGSPVVSGLLRMTSGTYNVGNFSNLDMTLSASTSSFIMEGGTMNFSARLNVNGSGASFNMSGGTINACTIGNSQPGSPAFSVSTLAQFTMSGGTINLIQANTAGTNPYDYQVSTTTTSVTGGTLNVGTSATTTNFEFRIAGAAPAIIIDNTLNNKTATFFNNVTAYGNVTINSGATLNLNTRTLFERGSVLHNSGTFALGSGTLTMISSSAQTISGSGTVTGNLIILTVQTDAGLTISHTEQIPTLRANLYQGIVTGSGKITMGTGAASAVVTQIGLAGITTSGGSFDVSPTWNLGTGTYSLSFLEESTSRTTAFEIPPTRTVTNLTIGNGNHVTLAGGNLNTGKLTLSGGKFITDAANLVTVTGTLTTSTVRTSVTPISNAAGSGTTITVTGASNLFAGMSVRVTAGTGAFADGTLITSVLSSTSFTVSIAPTTPLSGATINGLGGWVSGPLAITLPASLGTGSTYAMHIGKTDYSAFDLVNPTTTAGGTVILQSEVFEADAGGTSGTNMGTLNTNKYWAASISSGGANFTNSLIKITDVTASAIRASSAIATSNTQSGAYALEGGTSPTVIAGTSITTTAPQSTTLPGYFIIGTKAAFLLPVNLISFTGKKENDHNKLSWTTAQEITNKGFYVERSVDGNSFLSLGFIPSKAINGNSSTSLTYDFIDTDVHHPTLYYRLRQTDIDGREQISKTVIIKSRESVFSLSPAYPNPARSNVNVDLRTERSGKITMAVYDIAGRRVYSEDRNPTSGLNRISLNLQHISSGLYTLVVRTSDNHMSSTMFIKQ